MNFYLVSPPVFIQIDERKIPCPQKYKVSISLGYTNKPPHISVYSILPIYKGDFECDLEITTWEQQRLYVEKLCTEFNFVLRGGDDLDSSFPLDVESWIQKIETCSHKPVNYRG